MKSFTDSFFSPQISYRRGFTLIELIVVMTVIGVIAVIAVPRLENLTMTRAYYAARKLRSDVRYAQSIAMQTQLRTRMVFVLATDAYQVEQETVPGTWTLLRDPISRGTYQVDFGAGDYRNVDITLVNINATTTLIFDRFGRPCDGAGNVLNATALIDLNARYEIQLTPQTGRVSIVQI